MHTNAKDIAEPGAGGRPGISMDSVSGACSPAIRPRDYIPELDGLRAFAILGVLLYHLREKVPHLPLGWVAEHGWTGVDLFFVLSGFLITRILLNTRDLDGYFKNFYARRALRIWPLYYCMLVIVFAVLPAASPSLRDRIFSQSHPWQSYLFYLQNFFVRGGFGVGPVGPTWSLAIEEQFYFCWPLVVYFCKRRNVARICVFFLLLSPIARAWYLARGAAVGSIYVNTCCRLDGVAIGSLIACLFAENFQGASRLRLLWPGTAALGFLGYFCVCRNQWGLAANVVFRHSFLGIAFASVLILALTGNPTARVQGLLRHNVLRYIGKISYGVYLLHVLGIDTVADFFNRHPLFAPGILSDMLVFVAALALTFGAAASSWMYFERPILRLKALFENGDNMGPRCAIRDHP
jgi:peptidoglycan/LPS O-acetylase OafA/YrhL